MTAGIVLAAGTSTRMGACKQLLPLGKQTVVEVVVAGLVDRLEQVFVVLGHRAEEVRLALANSRVECVYNPAYASGMLSSVKQGLRAAARAESYLICLGDQPGISGETIDAMLKAGKRSGKGIVVPSYHGRKGHPILIRRTYRSEILSLDETRGLNVVTRGHPEDTLIVPVADGQILCDMDTPADYRREQARYRDREE
jgi:molybdenum cofactor cytidylyltransferase